MNEKHDSSIPENGDTLPLATEKTSQIVDNEDKENSGHDRKSNGEVAAETPEPLKKVSAPANGSAADVRCFESEPIPNSIPSLSSTQLKLPVTADRPRSRTPPGTSSHLDVVSPRVPPPKKENTPLPPTPAQPQPPSEPRPPSLEPSPKDDGSGFRGSGLRKKRSWSVSDIANAVQRSVGSFADKAKSFFANKGGTDSPDAKEDEREAEEVKRIKDWNALLAKNPNRSVMSSSRVNRLCWKGIPSSVRGKAWKAIIGNDLKITPELFKINLKRGKKLWEEQVTSCKGRRVNNNGADDGESREDSMRIIQADIPRTFPQLKFFHKEGPFHAPLMEVLQSYVCYRPDVGYVQGMSYLAAILLLNMPTFDAFQCLANLLNQDIYFAFFRMDVDKMKTHLKVYQALLKEKLPNLHKHFEVIDIKPGMYLYEWLLTIFSRSLPLDIAHRIWDNFLQHGQVFLFRTALGMLKTFEPRFLKMSFEDCLSILNRPPEDIDEKTLFENIHRIQLTSKRFERMVAKFSEEAAKSADNRRRYVFSRKPFVCIKNRACVNDRPSHIQE